MKEAWKKALADLQEELPPDLYENFIQSARLLDGNRKRRDSAVIEVTDRKLASRLQSNQKEYIQNRLSHHMGNGVRLEFRWPRIPTRGQSLSNRPGWLNPQFTFERFVQARSNRFAFLASEAVATQPGQSNPLFIYSDPGLGKTHLVHAIAHRLLERDASIQIGYVTYEDFRDEFTRSMIARKTIEFKDQLRSCDVFIMEHIHNVRGGSSNIQEELFHIFNHFYEQGRQIIFTSERPVAELMLSSGLLSRFLSGMHVQINAPEPELRRQILESRAAEVNLEIPESVKQELTARITGSMRELEAAVNRLYFLDQRGVHITDFTSTPDMMLEHFRDLFPAADNRHLPMDLIIEVICQKFKVTRDQILGNSRKAEFTLPRHVGMYLGIQHSNLNKSAVARYFRKGDHTTVLNAERNMMRRIEKEPGFSQLLDDIVNEVRKLCV